MRFMQFRAGDLYALQLSKCEKVNIISVLLIVLYNKAPIRFIVPFLQQFRWKVMRMYICYAHDQENSVH